MTLARRDRAAMTLALECVRLFPRAGICDYGECAVEMAVEALDLGTSEQIDDIRGALPRFNRGGLRGDCRVMRARLALLLRALLRSGAGDFGKREHEWCEQCSGFHAWHAPIRPLWESAPPHEVAR
jgi:hypothetical protein